MKRHWKKRILRGVVILVLFSAGLIWLVFSRLHFSHQSFPRLSQLQWTHTTDSPAITPRPAIIGHRGLGLRATRGGQTLGKDGRPLQGDGEALRIGNTQTAIQRAIDGSADWIEIDLRKTDGEDLVVFHDETVNLRTDKGDGEHKLQELSLTEVKALNLSVDPAEKILTLDEVFDRCHKNGQKWILDIKVTKVGAKVLEWLNGKVAEGELSPDQVILFGTYEVLQEYKGSGYTLGYTTLGSEAGNRFRVLFHPKEFIERCQTLDARYLVLPIVFTHSSLVEAARSKGIEVWVYGSEDAWDHDHSAERGITGLIVDDPEAAIKRFDN